MKRMCLTILVLILALGVITGCSKREEEVVNIYMWSDYLSESVVNSFEDETGIDVVFAYMNSSEEAVAKITSGGGDEYDLVMPCDADMTSLIKGGYLEEINLDNLPNMENLNPAYVGRSFDPENKYAIPYLMNYIYLVYNIETAPVVPTTYNDLLDPSLEGEIVSVSGIRNLFPIALVACGHDPNSVNEDELDDAYEWLVKYMKNVKVLDSDGPEESLINGDCSVAFIFDGAAGRAFQVADNLAVAKMTDPVQLGFDNFVIPKGSKHKENAEKFLNYILDADAMAENLVENPYTCPNEAAVALTSDEYRKNPAIDIPSSVKENYFLQLDIGEASVVYDRLWTKLMASQ